MFIYLYTTCSNNAAVITEKQKRQNSYKQLTNLSLKHNKTNTQHNLFLIGITTTAWVHNQIQINIRVWYPSEHV